MRRPTRKAILFFFLALGAGYLISFGVMVGLLNTELRLYGFINVTLVAALIAFILLVWLDKPFNLKLFEWPEEKPQVERKAFFEPEEIPTDQRTTIQTTEVISGGMFPHEVPSEHWDIDFGDNKQTYQGTDLPIWLLAGWAAFILWAVIYLVSGLPGAF